MADRNGELDSTEAWPPVGTNTYDCFAGMVAGLSSGTEVACAHVGECGVWDEPESAIWHFPTNENDLDYRTCPEHCEECNEAQRQGEGHSRNL